MLPVKYTFDRPNRTPVMKLVNRFGRLRPPRSWSADEIVYSAAKRAGINAWDDHTFMEPLQVLVQSFAEDAKLNPAGTLMIRGSLVGLTRDHLSLQDWTRRHPEILEERLDKPLMVVGMPRTGTSLLYNLLAQHPLNRPLLFWESVRPVPSRTLQGRRGKRRRSRARLVVRGLYRAAPQFRSIHPVDPAGPEECTGLMMQTFVSPAFSMLGSVSGYMEWHRSLDPSYILPRYGFYRKSLQMLQWENPPRHWVLKSPAHMGMFDAFLTAIPEANVVQLHRNMKEVLPSMGSLMATFRGLFSDDVDPSSYGVTELNDVAARVNECMAAREKHPGRVLDVRFTDLVGDPAGTTRQVLEHFGYGWSEEAAANVSMWLENNDREKHPAHRYSLEQFGVEGGMVDEIFQDYQATYLEGSSGERRKP